VPHSAAHCCADPCSPFFAPAQEAQLHRESPLGDAILECYASGTRNVFVLGFVAVRGENTVVLLARDTPANHPTIKDLNLDLTEWQPIIEVCEVADEVCEVAHEVYVQLAKSVVGIAVWQYSQFWK